MLAVTYIGFHKRAKFSLVAIALTKERQTMFSYFSMAKTDFSGQGPRGHGPLASLDIRH